jgi:hypothetical protein
MPDLTMGDRAPSCMAFQNKPHPDKAFQGMALQDMALQDTARPDIRLGSREHRRTPTYGMIPRRST